MAGRRVAAVAAVLVVGLVSSACRFEGLAFREDDRVEIVSPRDRAAVTLPVTVEWRVDDFEVTGPTEQPRPDAGYFAVFVDRTPQPPGETLDWLASDDVTCSANPDCPDEQWLADRLVFTTTDTSITIETVPRPDQRRIIRELHEVTIVLLDGQGRRIGESAFSVEFAVDRGTA